MDNHGTLSIADYIEQVKIAQHELYRNQGAAEVLLKSVKYDVEDWNSVMRQGGYYHVCPKIGDWLGLHKWLQNNIGRDHYSWNGDNFWFETEKAAIWFALHWA